MEKHTEREKNAWLYWIQDHWDEKSLIVWYLQQVAAEVRRSWVKNKKNVQMHDLHVSFKHRSDKPIVHDKDVVSKMAQAKWFGITGCKRKS
jgi:hypothetical protein